MCESVVSLSCIFTHPPEDKHTKKAARLTHVVLVGGNSPLSVGSHYPATVGVSFALSEPTF